MNYLQALARAVKFEGEVSDEVYARLCNAAADSARATLAEGRLFIIPQQLVEQCERFLGCLLQGLLNHGNARREDIVDGHQRAASWNKAGDIAYKELPMILKEFETAARRVIK